MGGATVTRHGDGSRRWRFGFEYEVAYDRAEGQIDTTTLDFYCYGTATNCGCADNGARRDQKASGTCGICETTRDDGGRCGKAVNSKHALNKYYLLQDVRPKAKDIHVRVCAL